MESVRAVLREHIEGVEEEIRGLRTLMRGLMEREGDEVRMMEAYSQAARRLGEMIAVKEDRKKEDEKAWVDEFLRVFDAAAAERGDEPISEQVRKEALEGDEELALASRRMTEEIATMRHLLRNAYRLARETQETQEYVRLVNFYGSGCVRLARMLKAEGRDGEYGRMARYIRGTIDQVIKELTVELGLDQF